MTENESSVIQHLIEVESQASSVTQCAQDEAAKRINAAKAKAEQEFLEKFNVKAAELEKEFKKEADEISGRENQQITSYKHSISSTPQDKAAFNKFMDSVLK